MTGKAKTAPKAATEEKTLQRPDLNPKMAEMRAKLREAAKDRIFFSWEQDDYAVVEITGTQTVETENGPSRLYTGVYLAGNIHGPEAPTARGGPADEGSTFSFWSSTVLENAIERQGVVAGDVLSIDCLGTPEGKRYKDYVVAVTSRARVGAIPAKAEEVEDDPFPASKS